MVATHRPARQGLYDPAFEHDACGIGFVVQVNGTPSHAIVRQGLEILRNLEHRGAVGAEAATGDGAGILLQLPHAFLQAVTREQGIALPGPGDYAVGMLYTSDADRWAATRRAFEQVAASLHLPVLGWRDVPTDASELGPTARDTAPAIRQVFLGRPTALADELDFERSLYVLRKQAWQTIRATGLDPDWHVVSLSSRSLVYKGMLTPTQVDSFYPDLQDERITSALALVHSRFSTNTFPSWDRAHPYRYIAHNGEINTLRGNVNWMRAREARFDTGLFGGELQQIQPVINPDGSDSQIFDNTLELLLLGGRSLPHALMMMVPEPWQAHESMDPALRDFYRYHASLMEPWDGPAAIAFTDGRSIGAVLDRNGLRPCRYTVTRDGRVILASEAGVLPVPPAEVVQQGRLQPGRLFLVDTVAGEIVDNDRLKQAMASAAPYGDWLKQHQLPLAELAPGQPQAPLDDTRRLQLQKAFGYSYEDLRLLLTPMGQNGVEAVGAMGSDTPLAVLSDRPKLLYDYFQQLFAQVTNPPIDSIREAIVTAAETTLGPEGDLLTPTPESCRQIALKTPILTPEELARLQAIADGPFRAVTLPIHFRPGQGESLEQGLERLFTAAEAAITEGAGLLILSDRGLNADTLPIPALLAVAGLHHQLIRRGKRTRVSLVLDSGEPREVHHFATLIGYGCGAICPYLAFESLDGMIAEGLLPDLDPATARYNLVKALTKGVIKVAAKIGISTLQSYRGAQIFEAIGLRRELIDRYFCHTASRIEGIGLAELEQEVRRRHAAAFAATAPGSLPSGGEYKWRQDGEAHLFSPETIHQLQEAVRHDNPAAYRRYAELVNDQQRQHFTLRGLLRLRSRSPIPLEEVEPTEAILRRFKTGAMSYGSISQEAHEALAIAMNRIGGKSNTGEGGEDPARYVWTNERGDSKNSAIKQVASGRFGVTSRYLTEAKEIQIKMAQGAKPGEGGQLPGGKVYPWIAKVRHSTPGVGLISPPPHHDIYSIEDLAELIHDLKNANDRARISVKLVSEVGVGTIAAGVAKAHADVVLISGFDGGTGASPQTSIKHAGLPWELGLAETHQTLLLNDLRSRIVIETDGQMKTGRDVVIAALLGAEEFGFATAPLVSLGCIMMRVCHLNTCPVGIATQNPRLRAKFTGDPEHTVRFLRFVAEEVRELMAQLGVRHFDELIGRSDWLEASTALDHWKAKGLDLSPILHRPTVPETVGHHCLQAQEHGLEQSLDQRQLLALAAPTLEQGQPVRAELSIRNTDRVVGTQLGSALTRRHPDGLPDDTVQLHFRGTAGQSFGAFIPRGLTLTLEGDANDYLGKGLSGGRIIVFPPREATYTPEENIIAGNVAFYGATGGEAFLNGHVGERFCVRNSGVRAVVEGVGDHGCEYMTGGVAVILGPTGRNFAAGMSGGVAYVLDRTGDFAQRCNREMVNLERLTQPREIADLQELVRRHHQLTGSARAAEVLADWEASLACFVKVIPNDYQRVLEAIARAEAEGLSGDEALAAAFEANARDLARIGGG